MKLKTILQASLGALFLSATVQTFASASQVTCPSIQSMRDAAQKLDTVRRLKSETGEYQYGVESGIEGIRENNFFWIVLAGATVANSFDDAHRKAITEIENVTEGQEVAVDQGIVYTCQYNTRSGGVAAAISFKNDKDENALSLLKIRKSLTSKFEAR